MRHDIEEKHLNRVTVFGWLIKNVMSMHASQCQAHCANKVGMPQALLHVMLVAVGFGCVLDTAR